MAMNKLFSSSLSSINLASTGICGRSARGFPLVVCSSEPKAHNPKIKQDQLNISIFLTRNARCIVVTILVFLLLYGSSAFHRLQLLLNPGLCAHGCRSHNGCVHTPQCLHTAHRLPSRLNPGPRSSLANPTNWFRCPATVHAL